MEVKERAAAKINLGLDVKNKRSDGYHNVETVMVSVDLADYLTFQTRDDEQIIIQTENSFLPLDERNYIYQAVCCMQEYFNIHHGVTIELQKNIPVSAGMGGGSSDAAATLRGLNRLWQLDASLATLAKVGERIGADVPFCLYGGVAYARGIGNELELLPNIPNCWLVLVKPAVSISTPKIFEKIETYHIEHPCIQPLKEAIMAHDFQEMCQQTGNALESITIDDCHELCKIRRALQRSADAVFMSGTGPTMVGIFDKETRARRAINAVNGFCKEVYLVRPLKK